MFVIIITLIRAIICILMLILIQTNSVDNLAHSICLKTTLADSILQLDYDDARFGGDTSKLQTWYDGTSWWVNGVIHGAEVDDVAVFYDLCISWNLKIEADHSVKPTDNYIWCNQCIWCFIVTHTNVYISLYRSNKLDDWIYWKGHIMYVVSKKLY